MSPRGAGKARRAKKNRQQEENETDENRSSLYSNGHEGHLSDVSHDDEPSNNHHKQKDFKNREPKPKVRISDPANRPEPISTENSVDSNPGHVRFAGEREKARETRKSHDSDSTNKDTIAHGGGEDSSMAQLSMRGPQYLAEILEADQMEDDLARMYETGFEMQMVERGMMETPSAAKGQAGHSRVPK